ncbi:MAG: membrane dipeptidase, partial [Xanthomonadales bacterium]|nr:membrane dipeptidase [Xanthomonadales bacterium]
MKLTDLMIVAVLAASPAVADTEVQERARQLARSLTLIDTHVDVPYRLEEAWDDVSGATVSGDFDYPRALEGGLNVPFMSIYTPAGQRTTRRNFELANKLIDGVEALASRAPDRFMLVRSPREVQQARERGLIGLAMGMENGDPIDGKLENVAHFAQRGVRYITLAHSGSNAIADSSFDPARPNGGLSEFGREVVAEMNRLGMMVDVSHLSDSAIEDVLEVSSAPVIASHSSARHFTPGFERNLSDELIRAVAAKGGVIMINFGSSFVIPEANDYLVRLRAERAEYL